MILFESPLELAHERLMAEKLTEWLGLEVNDLFYHTVIAANLALQQGHSCLYLPDWAGGRLIAGVQYHYQLPELGQWISELEKLPLLSSDNFPLVFENQRIYLRRYWNFEQELADEIGKRLIPAPVNLSPECTERFNALFPETRETDWQKISVLNALHNKFTVIAGGPGTGKTYTVTRLLACLLAQHEQLPVIRLVAPTGKAAQRLTESIAAAKTDLHSAFSADWVADIPEDATTIHRLLGVIPNSINFRHHQNAKLELDWLLIDEASMVDLPIMARLFRALPETTGIILLGDAEQLPSVAAGSVLADLTPRPHPGYSDSRHKILGLAEGLVQRPKASSDDHQSDYLSYLEKSHRFDGEGGIGLLANDVITGEVSASWQRIIDSVQAQQQLDYVTQEHRDQQLQVWVKNYYEPVIKADSVEQAWELFSQFRMLCATRVGPQGTQAINDLVTSLLLKTPGSVFKGLPVMVTENDYQQSLFNGDIGIVWPDIETGIQMAWFPNGKSGFKAVPFARLPNHETVFAMTIHKTQGSEFNRVVMFLPDQASKILSRELIYTGLTRAKSHFSYCGNETSWKLAVSQPVVRHSGLREKLGIVQLTSPKLAQPVLISEEPKQLGMDF